MFSAERETLARSITQHVHDAYCHPGRALDDSAVDWLEKVSDEQYGTSQNNMEEK